MQAVEAPFQSQSSQVDLNASFSSLNLQKTSRFTVSKDGSSGQSSLNNSNTAQNLSASAGPGTLPRRGRFEVSATDVNGLFLL